MLESTPEIMGKKIMDRTIDRNQDYGGILGELTGAQGTGKTGVLLSFTNNTMNSNPTEKIFWREQMDAPLQTFKLGLDNICFFVKSGSDVVFRDRNQRLKEIEMNPVYFRDYDELYDLAPAGKASVVFFDDDYEWMKFIHYLRGVGEWVNLFIDEMADIAPAVCKGDLYQRIMKFSNDMGAVRRCMMNCLYNTQTASDVHWTVRKKVMLKVFLPGAISDKTTRVSQKAIDNLDRNPYLGNEAYLDLGGEFGIVRFANIWKPNPKYHIEAHYKNEQQ